MGVWVGTVYPEDPEAKAIVTLEKISERMSSTSDLTYKVLPDF